MVPSDICKLQCDVIQQLWCCTEEKYLTPKELKFNLFLAADMEGNTAIYHTVYTANKDLVEVLLGVSKIMQLNPNDLRKLLVAV